MYMGLDLSLTNTGMTIVDSSANVVSCEEIATLPKNYNNIISRCDYISDIILKRAVEQKVQLVAIEDIFVNVRNPSVVMSLGTLHSLTKYKLLRSNIKIVLIAPTTAKKFLASGTLKKNNILKIVYQQYGVDLQSDDVADSYVLAQMCVCVDSALKGVELKSMAKHKVEAVEKVIETKERFLCGI